MEAFRFYQKQRDELAYAKHLAESTDDAGMRELALEEVDTLNRKIEVLLHKMRVLLLPPDPRDHKPIFLDIQVDKIGREQAFYDFERMYLLYLDSLGFINSYFKVNHFSSTCADSLLSDILFVKASHVYQHLKYEEGTHQFIVAGDSHSTRQFNVSVEVFGAVEEEDFELNMSDVRVEIVRCWGAGGQRIVYYYGVRMTHILTGLVVKVSDERSQIQNKFRAQEILRSKIYNWQLEQDNPIDRSKIIRTYDFVQNTVIDHRLADRTFDLTEILQGRLHQIIDQLIELD